MSLPGLNGGSSDETFGPDVESCLDEEAADLSEADYDAVINDDWLARVVEVVRLSRTHPDVRIGSSVRGAIDTAAVARTLGELRGLPPHHRAVGIDAGLVALSGRLRLREGCTRTAEDIVRELWRHVFADSEDGGDADSGASGKASAPTGATIAR